MNNKKKSSKLLMGIGKFFKGIYRIIDKIIVTPIAKLFIKITEVIKDNNKFVETLLNNKIFLIVLSLVFAFIVFFIVDNQTDIFMNKSADVLYNQPVSVLYNTEAYVVEGVPKSVDITLIGRQADIYLAKQFTSNAVTLDLRGLKPGTHRVALKYTKTVSSVEYKADPSTVNVTIYEKVSESRTISTDVLYEDSVDSKYQVKNITLSRTDVYVKGSQEMLKKVATVKALVDLKKITSLSVGTISLKDVPVYAYSETGEKLDVEVVPGSINASIEIASPSKEVPIKIIPDGTPAFGKSIDQLIPSTKTVTIYGDASVMENITYIPAKINVSDISRDVSLDVTLAKPSGIKELSVSSVSIKVVLGTSKNSDISDITLVPKNLANGYVVNAVGEENSKVTVTVTGTKSVIASLDKDSITAAIDLKDLVEGTYDVKVSVTGDDLRLTYIPKTKTVKVVIQKK